MKCQVVLLRHEIAIGIAMKCQVVFLRHEIAIEIAMKCQVVFLRHEIAIKCQVVLCSKLKQYSESQMIKGIYREAFS